MRVEGMRPSLMAGARPFGADTTTRTSPSPPDILGIVAIATSPKRKEALAACEATTEALGSGVDFANKTAFAADAGEVSEVIETDFAYHPIRRTA